MRITIDYDDTLTKPHIQRLAKKLVEKHEVYILTSRLDSLYRKSYKHLHSNDDIYETAKKVGIKPQNIVFTNQASKLEHIHRGRVWIHIDDNDAELKNISALSTCKGFSSLDEEVEKDVLEYLKKIE